MSNTSRGKIEDFFLKANSFHPMIKFTTEISETETAFLDTKVYKGERFNKEAWFGKKLFLTCERISNLRRPFNTRISICATSDHFQSRPKGREMGKNERAKSVRVGDPFPPPFPLYSRAPFDPFPPILRPGTQATLLLNKFFSIYFWGKHE